MAQRLQEDGLIRNAMAFKLLAKVRKKDTGIEQGTYQLSPSMTMSAIMDKLQNGHPDLILAGVNEGWRVAEYDAGFSNLPNFNSDDFDKIVQTGLLPDGTKLSDKYWYVEPKQPNTVDALEGYLYPDHYSFDKSADATAVVETMLNAFGEQLCPGPVEQPRRLHRWIMAQLQSACGDRGRQAARRSSPRWRSTTTPRASARYLPGADHCLDHDARDPEPDGDRTTIQGIASVYYNRWQHALRQPELCTSDAGSMIQADPTVQYAYATDNPPKAGDTWWPNVNNQDLEAIETKNPYNTYVFPGLPPGPISAPISSSLLRRCEPCLA